MTSMVALLYNEAVPQPSYNSSSSGSHVTPYTHDYDDMSQVPQSSVIAWRMRDEGSIAIAHGETADEA